MASPASNPQTNPTRTNNPRDSLGAAVRARSGSEAVAGLDGGAAVMADGEGPGSAVGGGAAGPSRESIKKLDQIIQVRKLLAATPVVTGGKS